MARPSLLLPALLTAASVAPAVARTGGGTSSERVRVVVQVEGSGDVADLARRQAGALGGEVSRTYRSALRGYAASLPAAALPALERAPGVRLVATDSPVRTTSIQPSPPLGLDRVDQRTLPLSGDYTFLASGRGVTTYVVDSGVRRSHSDFGGRVQTGFDAITAGGPGEDCNGHGTHVAGTVGGSRSGVAKGVTLVPVRVLDCAGDGTASGLLAGLDYVASRHGAGDPAVLNLSLAGPANSVVDQAVQGVVSDGVTVVVASGNEGTDACGTSPARAPSVVTVSASDPTTDRRPSFANYGSCVDLFAPGVSILSATAGSDTDFALNSGTSMAAPHVAGAAALVLETDPTATPAEVTAALLRAATPGVVSDSRSPTSSLLHTGGLEDEAAPVLDPAVEPSAPSDSDQLENLFTPVRPARIVDTRTGGGRLALAEARSVQVTGRGGVPATGVRAVVVNVTAVSPLGSGHITVYPADLSVPNASNVNHVRGRTVANLVAVGVSTDGRVRIRSSGGSPHVLVDVVGYYADATGSRSTAVVPARIVDTRLARGLPGRLPGGTPVSVRVAGRGGVPSSGVRAVVVNATVTQPASTGHLTVFPAGTTAPTTSNINYGAKDTVANLVVVGVGGSGDVAVQAFAGAPHLVLDVVGYYADSSADRFVPLRPDRLLDSRSGFGGTTGRLVDGRPITLRVGGRAGVPGIGVTAAVLNVTAVGATGGGHFTVYPDDTPLPLASTLNFTAGQTVPNLVLARVVDDEIEVRLVSSSGSPHVVVDVVGYTTAP